MSNSRFSILQAKAVHDDRLSDAQFRTLAALGKPVDDRRLKIYTETFKGVPYGLLQAAVSRALREAGNYNLVPAISAIWEALKKELHNLREMERAMEQWCAMRFWSVVHRFEGEA